MKDFDILIGCDPELFARRKGLYVSVHDILPGTKINPCKVPNGAVQVDGVAAEFNITPAKDAQEFVSNIKSVLQSLQSILNLKADSIELVATPTATFGQDYFDRLPFSVKQLGCEPDYSAYTLKANPKPETTKPFRTGSGHVHIQTVPPESSVNDVHSEEHMSDCASLVRELDVTLNFAAKLWDSDTERMSLYGAPGAFRPKPYGVEYRVLSNAWLRREELQRYVFDAAQATTKLWLNNNKADYVSENFADEFGHVEELDAEKLSKFLTSLSLPSPLDYVKAF